MIWNKQHNIKVIITGGPRSGTSFLSGLVSKMGYSLGDDSRLVKANEYNKYGYFENMDLIKISNSILTKMSKDFFFELPSREELISTNLSAYKRRIRRIVNTQKIDLYKGNRLMVLSDIYHDLYPDAKWIYIERDINETYKSRFGQPLSLSEWKDMTRNRVLKWKSSPVSSSALNLKYEEFADDYQAVLNKIVDYLEIELSQSQYSKCLDFYKPKNG